VNSNIFLKCDCGSHVIEVEKDPNLGTCFTLWHYGVQSKTLGFIERLRWIWRILITGNPWCDSIILDEKKIKTLITFLQPPFLMQDLKNTKSTTCARDQYGKETFITY
jgi:hypothetical protein